MLKKRLKVGKEKRHKTIESNAVCGWDYKLPDYVLMFVVLLRLTGKYSSSPASTAIDP